MVSALLIYNIYSCQVTSLLFTWHDRRDGRLRNVFILDARCFGNYPVQLLVSSAQSIKEMHYIDDVSGTKSSYSKSWYTATQSGHVCWGNILNQFFF